MIDLHDSLSWMLAAVEPAAGGTSWLRIIASGGLIGYIIIALSIVAASMTVLHIVQIRRQALMPPAQVEVLDGLLARGEVNAALEYCLDPNNDSFLTRILGSGLTRFQRSAFGAFEIKNAVEEAGQEQVARLYRSTDVLSVIGSLGPLLGLLGTVLGMVGAFDTLSAGATTDAKQLAQNISLALVTTLMGLVVAIPCMALFTYFRNRIDALTGETGAEIERLLLHLESTQAPPAGRPATPVLRPAPVVRPAPMPAPSPPPAPSGVAATATERPG